jgi:hypothetical protein
MFSAFPYMALIPLFTSYFFAILNDPVFENQELDTYLKLFILLYADDTVILAESSDDMQNQINYFYDFCEK